MDEWIYTEIQQLRSLRIQELRARYRAVFGEDSRTAHKQHLVRQIAWRLQVQAQGDLSERSRRRALEIASDADLKSQAPPHFACQETTAQANRRGRRAGRIPAPGTLLRRAYRDRMVVVKILADGFEYEGRRYGSLSAVARAATGTRWNGLLFFGLTQRGKEKRHAAPLSLPYRPRCAAPSTPASQLRRALARSSTPWTPSGKARKHTSLASGRRVGRCCPSHIR